MSDSDTDVSISDSESENEEIVDESKKSSDDEVQNEEPEEDELIKAIRKENERLPDHPPSIQCDDFVVDISFHPSEDFLAVANIVGDVLLYKYTNENNTLVDTYELHTKACRDIEFNHEGDILFSTSKDKTVMLTDINTGKLKRYYDNAHDDPIYCVFVMDENLFATGDDNGVLKLWDLRSNNTEKCVNKWKKNEDYISDIITNEDKKFLLWSSGDGSLTTVDMQKRQIFMQSEEYEEELTCLGLFRHESKLVSGTSKGKILLFNWNEFGLHSDEFSGPKTAISNMVPITENIVVTTHEDGNLRATHLFPHRHLGIVGQHDLSIETVDICNNGTFIASSGHNNEIKFWNIQYFEDFEKISHKHKKHEKKKDLLHNLPSSNRRNAADFFSDLI